MRIQERGIPIKPTTVSWNDRGILKTVHMVTMGFDPSQQKVCCRHILLSKTISTTRNLLVTGLKEISPTLSAMALKYGFLCIQAKVEQNMSPSRISSPS